MDKFTQAYIEAALWSTNGDDGQPLDSKYGFSDIAPASVLKMEEDCRLFQQANQNLLNEFYNYYGPEQAGHDFWLTRNHHGSGFWDEKAPKSVIEALTAASHEARDSDMYVGDDGLVYVTGGHTQQKQLSLASVFKKAEGRDHLFGLGQEDRNAVLTALQSKPMTTNEVETLLGGGKHTNKAFPILKNLQQEGLVNQKQMRWYRVAKAALAARRTLQPWDWHKLNIALKNMNMPDAMLGVMGGTREESRRIIESITGKRYEDLPESMKRGKLPKSIPVSLRKDAHMKKAFWKKNPIDAVNQSLVKHGWAYVEGSRSEESHMYLNPSLPWNRIEVNPDNGSWQHLIQRPSFRSDSDHMSMVEQGTSETIDAYLSTLRPKRAGKIALARKDYILIAEALLEAKAAGADIDTVAPIMAAAFLADNPRFNTSHFLSVVRGQKELQSRPARQSALMEPRMAGTPPLANIDAIRQAEELIENDDPIIYDVAADRGQIVGNVKHMHWFAEAVADWLEEDPTYYENFKAKQGYE